MDKESEQLDLEPPRSFSDLFWRKIKNEMRIDILLQAKPKKILKLYPIAPEDLHIDIDEVHQWSADNQTIYDELAENGFADFVCNREHIREVYNELNFDFQRVNNMDSDLMNFPNIKVLRLAFNQIEKLQHVPKSLKELYLFQNQIMSISPKIRAENILFLGLGHNRLTDMALNSIGTNFPNVMCLDLCFNLLQQIDITLDNILPLKNKLRMLSLYGNPIALVNNYKKALLHEFQNLNYFDEEKTQQYINELSGTVQKQLQNPRAQKQSIQGAKIEEEEMLALEEQGQQPDFTKFRLYKQKYDSYAEKFEQKAKLFQTHYWIEANILGQTISTKETPVTFDQLFVDLEDRKRLTFDLDLSYLIEITQDSRDQVRDGFLVYIHRCDPIMVKMEESTEEAKPQFDEEGFPKIQQKVYGVVRIQTEDWLKNTSTPREINYKYPIFSPDVVEFPEFMFPPQDAKQLLQKHQELIQQTIIKRDESLIPQEVEPNKKDSKKGKDTKKKDDKKGVKDKKGKDQHQETEEKTVEFLTWQTHPRNVVVIPDPLEIKLSHKDTFLAVKVEIQ